MEFRQNIDFKIQKLPTPTGKPLQRSYIQLYLDYGIITPFTLKSDSEKSTRIVPRPLPIKILQMFTQIVSFCFLIYNIADYYDKIKKSTPEKVIIRYYFMAEFFNLILMTSIYFIIIWRKQEQFKILNDIFIVHKFQAKKGWAVFMVLYTSCLVECLLYLQVMIDLTESPFRNLIKIVEMGYKVFPFGNVRNVTNVSSIHDFEPMEVLKGFGASFILLVVHGISKMGPFFLVQLCCLALWDATKQFQLLLTDTPESSLDILEKYKELRELSKAITKCAGPLVVLKLTSIMLYMTTKADAILNDSNWIFAISSFFSMMQTAVFFKLSCSVALKIQQFKEWVLDMKSKGLLSSHDFEFMIADISNKSVGIHGADLFTIDWGLLCNLAMITITHFIIVLQARV